MSLDLVNRNQLLLLSFNLFKIDWLMMIILVLSNGVFVDKCLCIN